MKYCLACARVFTGADWRCPHCGYRPEQRHGLPLFAPELASDTGFRDVLFDKLVALEAQNFWFRSRNRLILWALDRFYFEAERFMEIGCGTGFVLSGVAAARPGMVLCGSEISCAGLACAGSRLPGVQLLQMDARAIPFCEEFDVIGAFDVLEHVQEDTEVLRQMHRAVRPGGGILLTVPQHEFLWSRTDERACHVRRYAARDLADKVRRAGFRVEHVTSFVSLLLPLMFFSRLRRQGSDNERDSNSELRIGRLVNSALEQILTVERAGIRAGLRFPFGGSLLLVAKKSG